MNTEKLIELKSYLSYLQKYKRISSFRIDEKYKAAIVHVNSKRELISLMNMLGAIGATFNIMVMDERKIGIVFL